MFIIVEEVSMHDTYDFKRAGRFDSDKARILTSFPYTLKHWSPDQARDAFSLLESALELDKEHEELKEAALRTARLAHNELWETYSVHRPEVQPIYELLEDLIDLSGGQSAYTKEKAGQQRLPGL